MSAGVLLWILGWNVAAFCLMGVDKWKAKHGRWRLPEKVLFLSALAGGSVGALLGLWFQSVFVGLCTQILSICIFLVIYGRMIEVYCASRSAACNPQAVRGHFGNPALASR